MSKLNVAVLGPEGTNTEEVAKKRWGDDAKLLFFDTVPEVFDSVMKGEVDYGIVPVEDNVEGDVQGTINLFRTREVFITEEIQHEVKHWLLAKGKKEDIKKIVSHPQALLHCRLHLDKLFPDIPKEAVSSTAKAARMASDDPTIGAVANKRNAEIYNLDIITENIHDRGSNNTEFFCIKNSPETPKKGTTKTSIFIYPKLDRPGMLYKILGEFEKRKINLTQIKSRPSWGKSGDYIFYLTFDGNKEDPSVKATLDSIRAMEYIDTVRDLGSYSYKKNLEDKLNLPENAIHINENKIEINANNLELEVLYPINYLGKEHLIRRPHRGVLQLYMVN